MAARFTVISSRCLISRTLFTFCIAFAALLADAANAGEEFSPSRASWRDVALLLRSGQWENLIGVSPERFREIFAEALRDESSEDAAETHFAYGYGLVTMLHWNPAMSREERRANLFEGIKYLQWAYARGHRLAEAKLSSLIGYGTDYDTQRNVRAARKKLLNARAIMTEELPPDHPDLGLSCRYLAEILEELGQIESAAEAELTALDIFSRHAFSENQVHGWRLLAIGALIHAGGDKERAEELYRRALPLLEKHADRDTLHLALCNAFLGVIMAEKSGDEKAAVAMGEKALGLMDGMPEGNGESRIAILGMLSDTYLYAGEPGKCESTLRMAIAETKRTFGTGYYLYPAFIARLASLKALAGGRDEADALYGEALAAGETIWGPDALELCDILIGYGANKAVLDGDSAAGELSMRKALAILERRHGAGNPVTYRPIMYLGRIRGFLGDYPEADRLLREALRLAEALDPAGGETADALVALASSLHSRGDFEEADRLARRSLAIVSDNPWIDERTAGGALELLATMDFQLGRLDAAAEKIEQAIHLDRSQFGDDSLSLSGLYCKAALIADAGGDFESAIRYYSEAARIDAINLKPANPFRLATVGLIAEYRLRRGDIEGAERDLRLPLALAEAGLDKSHPVLQQLRRTFALACFRRGKYPEALEAAVEVERNDNLALASAFAVASERQRLDFVGHSQFARPFFAPSVLANLALPDIPERDAVSTAYAAHILQTKGAVLDSVLEDRERLRGSPEAEALLDRLKRDKQILANLLLHSSTEPGGEPMQRERAKQLRDEIEGTERELAQLTGRHREGRRAARATPEAVAARLPVGTVLIEFSASPVWPVRNGDKQSDGPFLPDVRYFAVLISPGTTPIRVIHLGDEHEINVLVGAVQTGMRRGRAVHDDLRRLHDLVWSPLMPYLGDCRRVFISPAGELNYLSFAVLLTPDERYLGENFTLSYLASGRDLLRQPPVDGVGAFVFADPDFAAAISGDAFQGGANEEGQPFLNGTDERRRAALSGLRLPRLPATRAEAEAMRRIFSAANRPLTVWLGEDASEARLKALRNPSIVHLATHGFFSPMIGSVPSPADRRTSQRRFYGNNPLLCSGLTLAGAANALDEYSPRENADDGIVTAEEVALLELWRTKLAVVSACDSGAGESAYGEGVMGLRRAFVQAGARDLLMTLWPIEDKTTARIIGEFYRRYLSGAPLDEALVEAQRLEINAARASGKNTHPRFWTPFVVSFQGAPQE